MEKIALPLRERVERGKQVNKLRAAGQVPAVVYGHGSEPIAVTVDERIFEKKYAQAGGNKIITLELEGKGTRNALIHELQRDPVTGRLAHADLYLVRMDEKIKTEVPIHFEGESTAVYQQDGTLMRNLEAVEVEALPADLPESFAVDISILDDFEKSIHVSDLKIPEGVELLTDPEELICKVEPPRTDEELAELDEAVEEVLPVGVAEEGTEGEGEAAVEEEGAAGEGSADKEAKPEAKEPKSE